MTECSRIEIKPITIADYVRFFDKQPDRTIRGYSFYFDGEMIAVFGALLDKDATMLFSDIKKGIDVPKITIWRSAKKALALIDDMKQPLYANSQSSGKFLCSLGFRFHGDTKYGKLYQYMG